MKLKQAILRIYAKHKTVESFWVGGKQSDGQWYTSHKEKLTNYTVNVTNAWSSGDCIIADAGADYTHKVVDCASKYKVSNTIISTSPIFIIYLLFILLHCRQKNLMP